MTTAQAEPLTRYIRQVAAADLSDRQLLERYAGRGDEAAFTALVGRHGPLVLGVCRRVLRDAHAAEDAFQATFLVLARKAGSLRRPEALGPWLHGVAGRVALKARSREARRRAAESRAAALAPATAEAEDPVWRDLRPLLDEAVGALPDRLRTPFVLHYLEGRTVSAIARHLGCPRGTVATHLARARQRLRARLLRRGLTLSAAALGAALSRQLAAGALAPALPGPLMKMAVGFAAGQAAAGAVPAGIAALAQGGLQTMSLKKQIILAVLLLGLGAVGGGTVLLAQGTGTKEQPAPQQDAAPTAPAEETDLALFRQGSKCFLAAAYRDADRSFSRLVERDPDSPLARQALELAIISKHVTTGSRDDRKVIEARRIINAVLAGANAAEAGHQHPKHVSDAERPPNWADKLFKEGTAHDFGRVPPGAWLSHRFRITNVYAEPLQITAVRTSSGCITAAPSARTLQPHETGCIEVTMDAGRFSGFKSADVYVTVGPEQASTVKLSVSAISRAEDQDARDREAEKRIEQLLQRPVNLNFKDIPLDQVVEDLRAWHGLNITIDRPALEKDHISLQVPITVRLQDVTLKAALNLLLRRAHLSYIIRDGALVVTTPAVARGRLLTQTHAIGDLAAGDAEVDALIRLIQRTLAPETWSEAGGRGTIDYYPLGKALVVNQTADVQEQLADFLEALRRLKGAGKRP